MKPIYGRTDKLELLVANPRCYKLLYAIAIGEIRCFLVRKHHEFPTAVVCHAGDHRCGSRRVPNDEHNLLHVYIVGYALERRHFKCSIDKGVYDHPRFVKPKIVEFCPDLSAY